MTQFLLWLLLLVFCWPLALLALLLYPIVWLICLPFRLLVAGANETPPFPRSFWSLTHLVQEAEIALSYAAADVFVLPTLAENLPNAALESVASGTPCVSFDVGGVPDVVRHMETGYLAKLGDADALAEGIRTLLADEPLRDRMGEACRALAEAEFGAELEAKRFADLYDDVAA